MALVTLPLPVPQETGPAAWCMLRGCETRLSAPRLEMRQGGGAWSLCHLLGFSLWLPPLFLPRPCLASGTRGTHIVQSHAQLLAVSCTAAFPPGCWQKSTYSCLGFPTPSLSPAVLGSHFGCRELCLSLWFGSLVWLEG